MKVAFHLRKRPVAEAAEALLVLGDEPAEVLRVAEEVGSDALPVIHRVAGGFLLLHPSPPMGGRGDGGEGGRIAMGKSPPPSPLPPLPPTGGGGNRAAGAIRLRAIAANLYVPVDADLVPTLAADEARALVRERGLIVLPGDAILAFNLAQPLPIARLVHAEELRRPEWGALPQPNPRADRIHSITLDRPEESPDVILESGGADIGSEEPRPRDSSLGSRLMGGATLGAAKALFHLGNMLGLKGLAGMGAQWMKQALEMAPRLSESLLGRQEAALRELLRQFREGKLEEALRRALPLGGDLGRGGTPYTGQELPRHNPFYSLSNILGNRGVAPSIWFGGGDVQADLAREYRHAAEDALRKGDHRRAAYIYAKLLGDYRMAANALMQGCLFHDAAILYLTKLDDRRAAARAFESAGELDRAVELYRRLGEHVMAGDALRRAGEEELALAEYREAAGRMAAIGNFLGAGDLMATKAEKPEEARDFFRHGWERRPDATAVPCGLRLARMHADETALAPLLGIVREAREYFLRPGDEVAAEQFFNELAVLADRPQLTELRDELRDHALLGLAVKLGQRAAIETRAGNAVSTLFGRAGVWPVPAVQDADYAFRAVFQKPTRAMAPRPTTRVRLGVGRVTAACHAPLTGDVFVGFLSGDVVCFRPVSGEVVAVKSGDGLHVLSLATAAHGEVLCVLQTRNELRLRCYTRLPDRTFRSLQHAEESFASERGWLTPLVTGSDYSFGMMGEQEFHIRNIVSSRRDRGDVELGYYGADAGLLLPVLEPNPELALLLFNGGVLCCYRGVPGKEPVSARIDWSPSVRAGSSLLTPALSWLRHGNDLEVAGLDADGVLNWSRVHFHNGRLEVVARSTAAPVEGFLAAAILRPSLVAAVSKQRIEWLRAGATHLTLQAQTATTMPEAVACFASAPTSELLVVCQDGTLERIAVPFG